MGRPSAVLDRPQRKLAAGNGIKGDAVAGAKPQVVAEGLGDRHRPVAADDGPEDPGRRLRGVGPAHSAASAAASAAFFASASAFSSSARRSTSPTRCSTISSVLVWWLVLPLA